MKGFSVLFFLLFCSVLTTSAQNSKPNFDVQGDLSKLNRDMSKAVLMYPRDNEYITDTVSVNDQKFSFSGYVPFPTMGIIKYIGGRKLDSSPIFLENRTIKITAASDQQEGMKIEGSASHDEYLELQKKNDAFTKEVIEPIGKQIIAAREARDTGSVRRLRTTFLEKLNQSRKTIYLDYLKTHPESTIAYYCLTEGGGVPFNPAVVRPYFDGLPIAVKESKQGLAMLEVLESGNRVKLGSQAPDFKLKNTLGEDVTLSSMKGTYVFLDFWASWCAPCRKEVPNVLKAFQLYKAKGFRVLAVSLDEPDSHDKWIRAIGVDKSDSFVHVIDMKGATNDVAKKYGVAQIPASFLISPSGTIISINLRGEGLHGKLREVFK